MHALGLCVLHLLLGDAPYEEAVEALRCPRTLSKKLRKVWVDGADGEEDGGTYAEVGKLLNGVDEDDATLEDTLYRNLVLFATSPELPVPRLPACLSCFDFSLASLLRLLRPRPRVQRLVPFNCHGRT